MKLELADFLKMVCSADYGPLRRDPACAFEDDGRIRLHIVR